MNEPVHLDLSGLQPAECPARVKLVSEASFETLWESTFQSPGIYHVERAEVFGDEQDEKFSLWMYLADGTVIDCASDMSVTVTFPSGEVRHVPGSQEHVHE